MATTSTPSGNGRRLPEVQPITHQRGRVIQPFGTTSWSATSFEPNEMQVWFIAEHLVETPLVHAK